MLEQKDKKKYTLIKYEKIHHSLLLFAYLYYYLSVYLEKSEEYKQQSNRIVINLCSMNDQLHYYLVPLRYYLVYGCIFSFICI